MTNKSGFTLIELMVVAVILVILIAIAVPNLLRSRSSANEASAVSAMRTISTGETSYQAAGMNVNENGISLYGTLENLGAGDNPFLDEALASGIKEGYMFEATPFLNGNTPRYAATGRPIIQDETGTKAFFVDDSGLIRFTADGTAPTVDSTPLN